MALQVMPLKIRCWTLSRGFSLLEVTIAHLLCLLLFLGWSQFLCSLQSACWSQLESHQIQLAAHIAQRALSLSTRQAGQNRGQDYLACPQATELVIESDFTGDNGDPDGALEHAFEKQRFRMNPDFSNSMIGSEFDQGASLQWKSGQSSFQAFVSRITKVIFQLDRDPLGPRSLITNLETRGRYPVGTRRNFPTRSFQFTFPVEKNSQQWFRYDLAQQK
ncbi:MAG: hypothetical protein HY644_11900 [Acidobacteria bacterium]|nr:hypothetical protein [Acidobacteriota bacterium]